MVEKVMLMAVIVFAAGAVFLISSSRCTLLGQVVNNQLESLNSGYNAYLAVGGTPVTENGLGAAAKVVASLRTKVNGVGPFILCEEDTNLELTACNKGKVTIILQDGKFIATTEKN